MLIIIDQVSKTVLNNMGANPLYPDGNIPDVEVREDEQAVRINDDSIIAQTIMLAMPGFYDLVFNELGEVIGVNVTKTIAEYKASLPHVIPPPTDIEILRLEQAQSNAEMIDLMMSMLGGM